MKKFGKDISHFTPLIGIFFAVFLGFFIFSYDRKFQLFLLIAMSISYVFWGVVHHKIHNDLHLNTVLEYIAVSLLGFVIIYGVLLRA